ncbi:MAG TPA: MFS transporter, partial [Candidatus Agrococcus pullicola]|nr:MFS transporter [Candidatus Agrococcus pullicola]
GRLDHIFGIYTFATSTGQMLGPLLLSLPSADHRPPLAVIFLITAAFGLLALLIAWLIRPSPDHVRTPRRSRQGTSLLRLLRTRGVVGALISSSLMLTSLDILLAYLPQYAEERGFAPIVLSTMLVVRGAATMASRLLLSTATKMLGRRTVLVASALLAGVALMSFILPLHAGVLIALMVLFGFALGTVQPLTMSWITLVTARKDRGVAASLRIVGNRLGQTAIPLAVAPLSLAGGAATVFLTTGASLLLAGWMSRQAPNGDESEHFG